MSRVSALGSEVVGTELSSGPAPRGVAAHLWSSLDQAVASLRGDDPVRVLDCGGGSGTVAVPLAGLGAEVTVVDVSIDALGILARRATESGVADRVTPVQGDAEALSDLFAPGSFDLVLVHDVLGDVPSVPAALSEVASVLRGGGLASIVIGNPVAGVLSRALAGDVVGALASWRKAAGESLDLPRLLEACQQAALVVEEVDGIGVFSELVPGIDLERPGAMTALLELEAATRDVAPYRDIASRLHVLARQRGPRQGVPG